MKLAIGFLPERVTREDIARHGKLLAAMSPEQHLYFQHLMRSWGINRGGIPWFKVASAIKKTLSNKPATQGPTPK